MKNYNEFINENIQIKDVMYHVTHKDNVESILKYGLLINKEYYMTQGGEWATEIYGCNPIFLSKFIDKTVKQQLKYDDDVIFEVDVEGLGLVVDLPSLIDHGAYVNDDMTEFYWSEGEEPDELLKYLDPDEGSIDFNSLLNPYNYVTSVVIELTGSAAILHNIVTEKIKLIS